MSKGAKTNAAVKAAQTDLPAFIAPCLATLVREPPSGDRWVHEIKFDGYRIQAHAENGAVRLFTRSGVDWTEKFAPLVKSLHELKVRSAMIDGEVIVEDQRGASSFVELVHDLKTGRSERMTFVTFDLLFLDGTDVRSLPLGERKALLEVLLRKQKKSSPICYSEHLSGDGRAVLTEACKLGLEGVISKRIDKPYRSGRHDDWLKSKCKQSNEFVVAGYLDSSAVKHAAGALVLGYYESKRLVYAGRVGTGFSRRTSGEIWGTLQSMRVETAPFSKPLTPEQAKGVNWVRPKLVAQVEYRAWTGDGLLRQATFKAVREDKPARQVRRPKVGPA